MILRPTALYGDKLIGIESIYTVREGMQINIPGKVEELRKRGQQNKLFCPCGCGSNLCLVAGQNNIRRQHFRIKGDSLNCNCTYKEENEISIISKIHLKCWLDEKLKPSDLDTHVPIYSVDDSNRKYEFSMLSKEKKIAISYCYDIANFTDDKIAILHNNRQGINVFYVTDIVNAEIHHQYPEKLMKIQNNQGYCLFIDAINKEYSDVKLYVLYYWENIDGFWEGRCVASDLLRNFYFIEEKSSIFLNGVAIESILSGVKVQIENEETQERIRRQEERERRRIVEEQEKKKQEEKFLDQLKRIEIQRQFATQNNNSNYSPFAYEKTTYYGPNQKNSQVETIQDMQQRRGKIIKCKYCGKEAPLGEFGEYSGNEGVCRNCEKTNSDVKKDLDQLLRETEKKANTCPDCGGALVLRNGNGKQFWGCSNFPRCRFTKPKFPCEK